MVTLVRYLLVASLPGWIIFAYSIFDFVTKLEKSKSGIAIFKKYEYSWGDNTGGDPTIYAKGEILGVLFIFDIGYQESYSKIDRFENEELSHLEAGDSINVWYSLNPKFATYRPPNKSKEQYIFEYKRKYLIYYSIYLISLIIFEYLFRKEWKNKKLEY